VAIRPCEWRLSGELRPARDWPVVAELRPLPAIAAPTDAKLALIDPKAVIGWRPQMTTVISKADRSML